MENILPSVARSTPNFGRCFVCTMRKAVICSQNEPMMIHYFHPLFGKMTMFYMIEVHRMAKAF